MKTNQKLQLLPGMKSSMIGAFIFVIFMLASYSASATIPDITSVYPAHDEGFAEPNENIVITFDQTIEAGLSSKSFKIYDLYGNLKASVTPSASSIIISGNTIEFVPYDGQFTYNTFYTIVLESGFVKNSSGQYNTGYAWEFTTKPDNDEPIWINESPPHESEGIYVGLPNARRNIAVVYFNEPVLPGTGEIEIRRVTDNSIFTTVDVTNSLEFETQTSSTLFGEEYHTALIFTQDQVEYLTEYKIIIPDGAIVDLSGNSFGGISDGAYTFTTEPFSDSSPPFATQLFPDHNSGGVNLDADISISFGEPIFEGSGTIALKRFSNDAVISNLLPSDAIIDNNLVTFDIPDLDPSTTYYVEISNGAFQDEADNAFAGTTKSTWVFTTGTGADVVAPQVVSIQPENGEIQIWTYEGLNIIFDEPIEKGIGTIYLRDFDTDEVVYQVNVADGSVSDYVYKQLAIDLPTGVLQNNHEYYVEMASGVITDEEGNQFVGFSKGEWTFKTTDTISPNHVALEPANNSTGIQPDATVTITYDEPIFTHSQGRFRIKRKDNDFPVHTIWMSDYTVSGNQVSFDLPGAGVLDPGEDYYIVDDLGSGLKDAAGNFVYRLWETEWNFKTFTNDDQGPEIAIQTPGDDENEVAVDAVFTLTFDEPIESSGGGTIYFYRASTDQVFRTVSMLSDEVTIEGNTMTIDPYWNLNTLTEYYIQMPGVVKDGVGNFFAGINDESWSFTTVDPGDITAPQYFMLDPADDAINVAVDENLTIYFNEPVTFIEGATVLIRPVSFGQNIEVPFENITVDGNSITLDPPSNLSPGVEYYVQITAVSDLSGNFFSGFGHQDYSWSFTTAPDETPPLLQSLSPEPGTMDVDVDAVFSMEFNERLRKGATPLYLYSAIDDQFVDLLIGTEYVIDDNTVILDSDITLEAGKEYYIKVPSTSIQDMSFNAYPGLEDGYWNFTTAGASDAIAPEVESFSPGNGSPDFDASSVSVTFDESILPGSGVFELYESATDLKVKVVDIAEASISGQIATFTIGSVLIQDGRSYYVNLEAGIVTDLSGNPFSGINNNSTWTFTTEDDTNPFVIAREPGNGEVDVPVTDPELTLYFNESIQSDEGAITLTNSDNGLIETYDVATSPNLSFVDNALIISPSSLELNTNYYITICNSCIVDLEGNSFNGYLKSSDWNFFTEGEDVAPLLASSSPLFPTDNAVDVETDIDLVVQFNEDVRPVEGGFAQIKFASSDVTRETISLNSGQAVFTGNTLTLTPSLELPNEYEFYVVIESGSVEDLAGNAFAGIEGSSSWNFTTQAIPDFSAPIITTLLPYNGQEYIAVDTELTMYFNEDIQEGTGEIVIRLVSDDSEVETIDISSATIVGNTLTLDISDLANLTEYYVDIQPGVIEDLSGNDFAGTDEINWSFTTIVFADTTPPTLVSSTPTHTESGLSANFDITLTFDEPIQGGVGFIQIYDSDDNLVQNFNGNFLTTSFYSEYSVRFDPPNDLEYGKTYYLTIPPGVITDLNNNSFTLTANEYEFSTNTTDIHPPMLLGVDPDTDLDARPMSNFNIFIHFDEAVNGSSGASVNVRRADNDEIAFTRTGSSFIGANGNKTRWIQNVHNSLDYGVSYYLEVESGAFEDAAGNDFPGFGQGTYDFTMEPDVVDPFVISTAPTIGDDDANRDNLIVFFSEPIALGTGNVLIRDVDGNIIKAIDINSPDVTIDGTSGLLIELGSLLPYEQTYHVEMPAETITDLAGNPFHGYYDDDWSFTMKDKNDQTITFGGIIDRTFGDPDFNLAANATSGQPVSFEIVSGPAEMNGIKLKILGTGDITVRANQEGNEYYNAAEPAEQSFTVNKAANSISFSSISTKSFGDDPFSLTASSSSGEDIEFSVVSGPVLVEGDLVIIIGAGSATIRAEDAGNDEYEAASAVERSFTINKIGQTIDFDVIDDKLATDEPFALEASASSGLNVDFEVLFGPATFTDNVLTITGLGSVGIRATQSGDANYNAATFVDQAFTVSRSPQTIDFSAIETKTFGDAVFQLVATSSSGESITYSRVSGPISVTAEGQVTITGAGTAEVNAFVAQDDTYLSASENQSFVIEKADQVITFGTLDTKTFGDSDFDLVATSDAGLSASFASSNLAVATVSGSTISIIGAGTTEITASQSGNDDFNSATPVIRTLTVNKASQTISITPIADKLTTDADFDVSASVDSGNPLTYSVDGPATISGTTITLDGTTGTVSVIVEQSGNDNYEYASEMVSFQVGEPGKLFQSITFDAIEDKTYGDADFDLTATATSGLDVVFSIVSGPATIEGNVLTITGAGSVLVAANQSGDDSYNAAVEVQRSFIVDKADQNISFDLLEDKTYGDAPFNLSAVATSGLDVTFSIVSGPATISGNTVSITGVGSVTVASNQGGDHNYNAAEEVQQSFSVIKADQSIAFGSLEDKTYGDASFELTASSSAGLEVVFTIVSGPAAIDENELTITGAGTVVVAANQVGDSNFNPAQEVQQTFEVEKADQVITLASISDKSISDGPFDLVASVDTELELTYEITGPASISGTTITLNGNPGTVTLTVIQIGNANYNEATETLSFEVLDEDVLAVDEFEINFYPNPVIDVLTIESKDEVAVRIYNLKGRLLRSARMRKGTLDLSDLSAGMYLMQIINDQDVYNEKLIKAN